ncbi:hypothetical protein [Streptacidiphilus sp. MAP5-3]
MDAFTALGGVTGSTFCGLYSSTARQNRTISALSLATSLPT